MRIMMSLESIIGGSMRTKLSLWRRIATLSVSVFLLLMIAVVVVTGERQYSYPCMQPSLLHERNNQNVNSSSTISAPHRRLLRRVIEEVVEPNRIWGDRCSKSDIVINQGPTAPLPSGIPTYTVEIMNVCVNGCDIGGIHLNCGWFSSARLINPRIFKRLRFDDCLVNDGKPLVNGRTISFQYANTFRYTLSVASVAC